jgi:hypothetical protein
VIIEIEMKEEEVEIDLILETDLGIDREALSDVEDPKEVKVEVVV